MTRSTVRGLTGGGWLVWLLAVGCAAKTAAPDPGSSGGGEAPAGEGTSARHCALVLCGPNTYCDDASGEAQCLPEPSCAATTCPEGQTCQLVQVQCIRAPCPPQPTCLPSQT
jgi:hypothetical protein